MLCSTVCCFAVCISRKQRAISSSLRFVTTTQQLYKQPANWGSRKTKHKVALEIMDPRIEEQLTPLRQAVKEQVYTHFADKLSSDNSTTTIFGYIDGVPWSFAHLHIKHSRHTLLIIVLFYLLFISQFVCILGDDGYIASWDYLYPL